MNFKSIKLLKATVIFCMVLVLGLAAAAPFIVEWYVGFRKIEAFRGTALLVSYYICMIPALTALYSMLKIIIQIQNKQPFANTALLYLGLISWCCLAVGFICGGGAFFYPPLAFLSAAMLFLFLTVRVVKICFSVGMRLQEENDLTV